MNRFERRSIESYDKKAADYDHTPEGRYTQQFTNLLRARVAVPQDGYVLDVACGNGRLLRQLSAKHTFSGYGVDISSKMVDCAKAQNPDMSFAVASCDKLPYTENFFDVLAVSAAFHHFPRPKDFAAEAARVLKAGGRLYLAEVYYPAIIRLVCNPFVPLSKAGDVKFYAPQEIRGIFESADFVQEAFEASGHVQLLVLRRRERKGRPQTL